MARFYILILGILLALPVSAQRHVTPIDTGVEKVIVTKAEREKAYKDSIAAARDSIKAARGPMPTYPLIHQLTLGVNIWDPIMRALGQDYGLVGFSLDLNFRNRFIAAFEAGIGSADHVGDGYHYKSPVAPYFKIGADYNFMFRKSPDYLLCAGFRYGLSPFKFEVTDAVEGSAYWGETDKFSIPSQSVTAGYLDLLLGIRVRLVGNLSMGWSFRYHNVLHGGKTDFGEAYYIPGYGSRSGAVTGTFSIYYNLPIHKKAADAKPATPDINDDEGAI